MISLAYKSIGETESLTIEAIVKNGMTEKCIMHRREDKAGQLIRWFLKYRKKYNLLVKVQ